MMLNKSLKSFRASGTRCILCAVCWPLFVLCLSGTSVAVELKVAAFQVDATPPLGAPLCDGMVPPVAGVGDPLSARGVVLKPEDQPAVVLVAVDWVGIGNEGHDAWRSAIASACETDMDRVCVHALHQHDAPGCDFAAEDIAAAAGIGGEMFDVEFARQTIERAAEAARDALAGAEVATHIGHGVARVENVASNRRILGPDGKVQIIRWSKCEDPEVRALPEGTIDPNVRMVSFWRSDLPIVVMSYYATHPQSYYRTGKTSADFVGLARDLSEKNLPAGLQIHFNGAGGNITAGKYNDGSHEARLALADRLADGMKRAWSETRKKPLAETDFAWNVVPVVLPVADWFDQREMEEVLRAPGPLVPRIQAARMLAFAHRSESGHAITIARLRIGDIDLLHLPGEAFIEYQLAAQAIRPQRIVCTAAYGDYGPGYIGMADSYAQGGYETSRVSRVSPRVETALMKAIRALCE